MTIIIPPLDAMFFLSETPASPKHVGALQIFERAPHAPRDYLKQLVTRMKSQPPAPPFNYRPIFPRAGMPQWQVDGSIDMDYHVRHSALPAPGDTRQLLDLVERLHGSMLDRQRPCWFCQVIEGLEGNRFAVYSKVHHSLIDGMSGVRRMHAALSSSPRSTAFQAPWAFEEQQSSRRPHTDTAARWADVGRTALAQARAAVELSGTLARMGLQWMKIQDSFHQVPFDAPRSLMNRALTHDARAVGICTLPLDRVKAAGATLGGTVNDVLLAVVDAALHEYLAHCGEPCASPLVALCPMSLREDGEDAASARVSALHVRLGEPQTDMRTRLAQVVDSATKSKQEAREMSRSALMDFAVLMFGAYELFERTGLQQRMPASYNVLMSNVPGPAGEHMYLRGSRLIASYPISTFLPGTNLNVTVLSHGNSIDVGVMTDRLAMPDAERLAGSIVRSFDDLERALARPAVKRATRKGKSPRTKPAARR